MITDRHRWHNEDKISLNGDLLKNERTMFVRMKWTDIERKQLGKLTGPQIQQRFLEMSRAEKKKGRLC